MLSIILPSFNSKEYYRACLKSLLKIKYPNFEVIIVDDGSTDGSFEAIQRIAARDQHLKLIQTLKRRGIPASRNIGIEAAQGDLIAFFDMDMEVTDSWPNELIKVLMEKKDIGAVLPKVMDFHQRNVIQSIGGRMIPYSAWVLVRGLGQIDKGQYEQCEEVSINAAGAIIKKEAVRQLKGFDESLGMFDDLDFGWRLWVAGWRSLSVPKAIIYHWTIKPWTIKHGGLPRVKHEYYQANVIRMMFKNLETDNLMKYLPVALAVFIAKILVNLLKGNTNPLIGTLKAWWGIAVGFPQILKQRQEIQTNRKFPDSRLWGSAFVKGNVFDVYFKSVKKNIEISRVWNLKGEIQTK